MSPRLRIHRGASMMVNNANNHAQQHFHNHNASIGRIPAGAMPTRGHTRELSNDSNVNGLREQGNAYPSIQSALSGQCCAVWAEHNDSRADDIGFNRLLPDQYCLSQPIPWLSIRPRDTLPPEQTLEAFFGMPMLAAGMQQMNINGANGGTMYPPQNYTGYGSMPYGQGSQSRDSQARVIQHRRQLDNEGWWTRTNTLEIPLLTRFVQLCRDITTCP